MRRVLSKRVLQLVVTLFGITLIAFFLLQLAPGDPIALQGEVGMVPGYDRDSVRAWRELKGLDQPILWQYLVWLGRCATLDFGRSLIDERPVRELIAEAAPPTLLLNGLALMLIYALAVPLGILCAVRVGSRLDRLLAVLLFGLYSLPSFWVALLLIVFLGGGEFFDLFPIRGLRSAGELGFFAGLGDLGWHLVLPLFCLAYPALAHTSRFQRAAMLEVIGQDYMRTARAKGLSERAVILRHGLKNSLLPIVTLLSLDLPVLVGGSLIVERIFTIRGMGMLMFEAILRRDYPVIMGVVTLVAIGTMVAVWLGDLAVSFLDPRIRFGGRAR